MVAIAGQVMKMLLKNIFRFPELKTLATSTNGAASAFSSSKMVWKNMSCCFKACFMNRTSVVNQLKELYHYAILILQLCQFFFFEHQRRLLALSLDDSQNILIVICASNHLHPLLKRINSSPCFCSSLPDLLSFNWFKFYIMKSVWNIW